MVCGCGQLGALLKKNAIEKKRNIRVCCCESFSHLIILTFLVFGYNLSKIKSYPDRSYYNASISIPSDISFAFSLVNNANITNSFRKSGASTSTGGVIETANKILAGPIPVPSFDQFIMTAKYLHAETNSISGNPIVTGSSLGRSYQNLLNVGTLHFAPRGQLIDAAIKYMNATSTTFSSLTVYKHDSEDSAVKYILSNLNEVTFALIIINSASSDYVDYTIRLNYSTLPNTNVVYSITQHALDTIFQRYITSGFMTLQNIMDEWAFSYTNATKPNSRSPKGCTKPATIMTPFPTAAYKSNPFYGRVGFLLGLAMTMATLYPMSRLVKAVVEEKETKMREVMKIMGLLDWVHQLSWFLTAFVTFFWIAISATYITTTSFIRASNTFIIFGYFFLFTLSEINLSFLVAVFFSNSKLAAIVGPVVLFATLLPRFIFLTTNANESQTEKYLASILSPTAFSFGADIIASYEDGGIGVQFSNIGEGLYNFSDCLSFMFFDAVLYGVLAWYLDQVLPTEYGTPRKPWFILLPSYWCPGSGPRRGYSVLDSNGQDLLDLDDMSEFATGEASQSQGNIEPIPADMKDSAQVVIKGLTKRYDDGKLAVKGLDMVMLEGQITCLLGHNGAGKTTTISMLTGMLTPTAGNCSIWGRMLSWELPAIRQMTGVCPQINVLFPSLTVNEHLRVFGALKGLGYCSLSQAVTAVIAEVGLTEKTHVLASALSGGMKRKLCLAMALVGDPKFVLLDEPTSGMDPYSRRSTWELLQRCKKGRVVVLTTHFMDEADILGDRIAIMSEGKMRCSGTSLFLKKKFGAGYLLFLAKATANCSVSQVTDLIQSHVQESSLTSSVAGELVYQLPVTAVSAFGALFTSLATTGRELGIGAYGISITTLEQVFITLAQENHRDTTSDKVLEDDDMNLRPGVLPWIYRTVSSKVLANYRWLRSRIFPETRLVPGQPMQVVAAAEVLDIESFVQQPNDTVFGPEMEPYQALPTEVHNDDERKSDSDQPGITSSLPNTAAVHARQNTPTFQNVYKKNNLKEDNNTTTNVDQEMTTTVATNFVQFQELIRKRLVIAGRDLKGLFYQIFFPALQIVLVLLLLTININPAGQSQKMNTDIYPMKTQLYTTGAPKDCTLSDLSVKSLDVTPLPLQDSRNLSNYLLKSYNGHGSKFRFGSISFHDTIYADITVDWNWVRRLNLQTNQISSLLGVALPNLPTNVKFSVNGNLTASQIGTIGKIFNRVFNITVSNSTILRIFRGFENTLNRTINIPNTNNLNDLLNVLQLNGIEKYTISLPSEYTVLHNSSSQHGIAVFTGELVAAAFRHCSPHDNARYVTRNHPLPLTAIQSLEIRVILAIFASLFILIPLCYIPAAFVTFIVRERASKSKHLQIVSSVSPYLYWMATYFWDMCQFSVLVLLIMGTFYAYGEQASQVFVGTSESALSVFLLLWLYGASSIPLSYIYSFAFENHSTAQISIITVNFITGFVCVLGYYILVSVPETQAIGEQMVNFFRLFPPYNVGEGLVNLSGQALQNIFTGSKVSYLSWEVTGRSIIFMFVQAIGYFSIVLMTESTFIRQIGYSLDNFRIQLSKPPPPLRVPEDADVQVERERLADLSPDSYALLLRDLTKTYPSGILCGQVKHAVRGVSLGCPVGETFGLLGVNGAGKTTTLSILTGDFQQSGGEAYIAGQPLSNPLTRKMIGYCPQVDPLLDLMTGYETLWFFGRIRGMEPGMLAEKVERLVVEVGLKKYAHKPCGTYSGGNKRKLSLAVALIGDPKVLFLDEPSTGMDPEARRSLWSVIAEVARSRSVVLTTHSMEECEALCSRVGIMVSGRLQCLGSIQHLKGRFGANYQIEVRCETGRTEECLTACMARISGSALDEQHGCFFRLKVQSGIDLAATFHCLEEIKTMYGIVDYSVSQATLEQIFIKFAKEQEEEPEKPVLPIDSPATAT